MTSSTFSFNKAASLCALGFLATMGVRAALPFGRSWLPDNNLTANHKAVTDEYFTSHFTQALDYYVFWNDFERIIDSARQADVLILGDSRSLYGFNPEVLNAEFSRRGLSWFNLSFGYGEGALLPINLIQRFGIRPKIVIINADSRFFLLSLSSMADAAVSSSRFRARKQIFEVSSAAFVSQMLERILPRWLSAPPVTLYRSKQNGSLLFPDSDLALPITDIQEDVDAEPEVRLEVAGTINDYFQKNGTKVFLTYVPTNNDHWLKNAKELAKTLKVPFIEVSPEGLETIDGNHMTKKSGAEFTRRFMEVFQEMPH